MNTYRTVAGDEWDVIARKTLGSELYMDKLMKANPKYMGISVFDVGTVLTLPTIEIPRQRALPPWKR